MGVALPAALGPLILLIAACTGVDLPPDRPAEVSNPDEFLIVDCLLPGAVRQLGASTTYVTPRRPARTSALDCAIRGGEFTAYDRADASTSLAVWLPLAEKGDAEAQNYVGEIYERGMGLEPDYAAAAEWYRRAAEQNYAPAEVNLGQLHELGRGVARDPAAARAWYRRASGLPEAGLEFLSSPSEGELAALREQLEATRAAHAELERTREELEGALASRPAAADVQGLRAEVDRLQQEVEAAQRTPDLAALPGPSIRIIEPVVPASTRGLQVARFDANMAERVVIGQVVAAAGVLRVLVNDQPQSVSEEGIFETKVITTTAESEVRIIAIDRVGRRAEQMLVLRTSPEAAEAFAAADARARSPIDFGRYYALVIGNDQYQELPDLETARNDGRAVAEALRDRFHFDVTFLEDATRYEILSAMNDLRIRLTSDDNLLIYYAGHGQLDELNQRGHWLPVDAERDSDANWISNISITDILNAMSARHVIVISDSCYSGSLTRSSLANLEPGLTDEERLAWRKAMSSKRSRTALTSGGLAPVLDAGSGGHSVFASAVLEVLRTADDVLEGQQLYQQIAAKVTYLAEQRRFEQVPQYAPIKFSGHESGDFFFVPNKG